MAQAHHSKSVKLLLLKTNCYFTDISFFIFIAQNQQDHLSYLSIAMLIDGDLMDRYKAVLQVERINWHSFVFKIEALNNAKANMIVMSLIFFYVWISNTFATTILTKKKERGVEEEVIYGCERGLYRRLLDSKFAMHSNCFNEIQRSMRQNGMRNRPDVISLDRLKSCCHYNLRGLCAQNDGT